MLYVSLALRHLTTPSRTCVGIHQIFQGQESAAEAGTSGSGFLEGPYTIIRPTERCYEFQIETLS